jgi:hypothetical protein
VTSCFVDSDHAGCRLTRRSHTGVLIFVNNAPILWHSKRQNTVESSMFGSEFVALQMAVDMIEGLRYKLRMMGVPLDGSTSVFCDNEGVVKNTTAPESPLKKKHVASCYHRCPKLLQLASFSWLRKIQRPTWRTRSQNRCRAEDGRNCWAGFCTSGRFGRLQKVVDRGKSMVSVAKCDWQSRMATLLLHKGIAASDQ